MSSCGKNAAHPWSQSDLRTLETEENIYWKISTEQIVFQTNKIWFLHHAPFDLYASMTQTCSSDLCFLQLLGTNSCPDVRQLRMRTVWKKKQKQRVIFWLSVLLLHWVDKLLIAKEQRKKKQPSAASALSAQGFSSLHTQDDRSQDIQSTAYNCHSNHCWCVG